MTRISLEDLESTTPIPFPADLSELVTNQPYDLDGVIIVLEYLRGETRTKTAPDGTSWSQVMPDAYGYIVGTKDRHGEEIDVYVSTNPDNGGFTADASVFVIDQVFKNDKTFDEHKCMLGYKDVDTVKSTYFAAFGDGGGPDRLGAISEADPTSFHMWIISGLVNEPVSDIDFPGFTTIENDQIIQDPEPDAQPQTPAASGQKPPPAPPKPPMRNGAEVIGFPISDNGLLIVCSDEESHKRTDVFMTGYFCSYGWKTKIDDIVRIVSTAAPDDVVVFHISSYGGDVDAAARLCSAVARSKATVRMVAAGPICSAATLLWSMGTDLIVKPGAYFMEHMSSHGDGGNSMNIAFETNALIAYVTRVLLKRMRELKLYTDDEFDAMITKRQDIYIDAPVAAERLGLEVDTGK